jgi:hypothetical protein
MLTVKEVIEILNDIDNNTLHPINDARHPLHPACVKAYGELIQWCDSQQDNLLRSMGETNTGDEC